MKKQHTKSQNQSQDDNTTPSTSTIRYLRQHSNRSQISQLSLFSIPSNPSNSHENPSSIPLNPIRKNSQFPSQQSQAQPNNFCFSLTLKNCNFSILRVYIDSTQTQQKLYYTKLTPNKKCGQICIFHGYGQNSDAFLYMGEYFAKRGYVVHLVDMRGCGYSGGHGGQGGHVRRMMGDIETMLRKCCERDLATFLIASGIGVMALHGLLQENLGLAISGVICIGSQIGGIWGQNNEQRKRGILAKGLGKMLEWVFGSELVSSGINPTALARDPLAIKERVDSIFWQSTTNLKISNQLSNLSQKILSQSYKFTYPILLCHGALDTIQPLPELKSYYSSLSSQDKQLIIFPQSYHQLHNDYQSDQLLLRVYNWIESRKSKGKIKWKSVGKMKRDGMARQRGFWSKIIAILWVLIGIFIVMRKYGILGKILERIFRK